MTGTLLGIQYGRLMPAETAQVPWRGVAAAGPSPATREERQGYIYGATCTGNRAPRGTRISTPSSSGTSGSMLTDSYPSTRTRPVGRCSRPACRFWNGLRATWSSPGGEPTSHWALNGDCRSYNENKKGCISPRFSSSLHALWWQISAPSSLRGESSSAGRPLLLHAAEEVAGQVLLLADHVQVQGDGDGVGREEADHLVLGQGALSEPVSVASLGE